MHVCILFDNFIQRQVGILLGKAPLFLLLMNVSYIFFYDKHISTFEVASERQKMQKEKLVKSVANSPQKFTQFCHGHLDHVPHHDDQVTHHDDHVTHHYDRSEQTRKYAKGEVLKSIATSAQKFAQFCHPIIMLC